ncbi:hypothetical protein M0802_004480 [Mischocyttarus mexicanus]|nr:hypothetical protein M0802_004480 [Mischocyttarus mexicanus]
MESVVKKAKPYEKAILTKYVEKCAMLHMSLTFGFYLAATNIVLGPIFLPQPLPTFAIYPFNVETHPTYEIVYLMQAITGIQASSGATIDCQVAILLWFAGARFEMLQFEISNIVDEYDLKWCILKHRNIVSYAENVTKIARFVILTTVAITTTLIVFSGFLLVSTDSLATKFQFFVLDIVSIIQLFVNSYPAENLIEMSSAIGSAAYNLNWVEKSQTMSKKLNFSHSEITKASNNQYSWIFTYIIFNLLHVEFKEKKMILNISPNTALKFTKLSVIIMGCWPPPLNATKKQLLLRDVYWWSTFVTALLLVLTLINGIYEYRHNTLITVQTTCILAGVFQVCLKMIIMRIQRWKFQSIIQEMENFIEHANSLEKVVLQNYVNKCWLFHLTITIGFYMICSGLVLGPAILSQPFPTFAKYPFKVDSHPIYEIVYFQQAFVGILAVVGGTIDCQNAVLLWFASARFEMLSIELSRLINLDDINYYIRKHLQLLRFFSMRQAKSTTIRIQFVILVIGATIQLFICSRPAENLSEMSIAVGLSIYNSNWIGKSSKILKSMCIMIQRSQKPVIVTISGVLPALSLKYYTSFLSSSFSYFTTLYAVVT